MPKPTPATIKYKGAYSEQADVIDLINTGANTIEQVRNDYLFNEETYTSKAVNTIKFHAVVSEGHTSKNQVTKFPIQNGFEISNHAIRKNREIELTGYFSNVLLHGSGQVEYETTTSNTINTVYEAMQALVNGKIPCQVTTNLGVYDPVVFTKIKTKQMAGRIDSIEVIISGEEIQVASNIIKTGPKELVFTQVPAYKRTAVMETLADSGLDIPDNAILSTASAVLGEDFSLTTRLTSGELFSTTYIKEAWDGLSNFVYSVHTDNLNVFSEIGDVASGFIQDLNIPLIPTDFDLVGALDNITGCLLSDGGSVIVDEAEKYVDTALGRLRKSAYGVQQGIINLGKDDLQKSILGTALDCVTAGTTNAILSGNSENFEDVLDETLVGIKRIGDAAIGVGTGAISAIGNTAQENFMTFIKVESPDLKPLDKRGQENAPST